jgi:putative transposase
VEARAKFFYVVFKLLLEPASAGLLDSASARVAAIRFDHLLCLLRNLAMSSHVYHEIYLHLNWHTKLSRPLLDETLEPAVHNYLRDRCRQMKGVYFHGVGGTETHIHLAVNIEPFVCISDMVRELKGACSHDINERLRRKALEWQRGFGVVSFGTNNLGWVLDYIKNQKEHHAAGTVRSRLERIRYDDNGTPLEDARPPSRPE